MQKDRLRQITAGLGVFCLLVAGWVWLHNKPQNISTNKVSNSHSASDPEYPDNGELSPLSVVSPVAVQGIDVTTHNDIAKDDRSTSSQTSVISHTVDDTAVLDASNLLNRLQQPVSEDDWQQFLVGLRNSPYALQQVADIFRQMPPGSEKNLLARLLAEVGSDDSLLLASELVYSGDITSRKLGLSMLQVLQSSNAHAHQIAYELLLGEVEADVIVDTLTAFARPGVVDQHSREYLVDQVVHLTSHEDYLVRGISYDILSRWVPGKEHTSVFLTGLRDPHPHVRELTTFALLGSNTDDQAVRQSLRALVISDTEPEGVRRGAILALRSMSLSPMERDELLEVERSLNTVIR